MQHNPYDLIADQWDNSRSDLRLGEDKFLNLFLESLAPNSLVLDMACGTGKPNAMMVAAAGHRIVGIDRSQKLLDVARENVPDARLIHAEMEDFILDDTFDGVICWDALFHLERSTHRPILEKIRDALRDRGRSR